MKPFKPIIILVKVARESFAFAYQSISVNRMRTFLSLLGITIGIFAIISVFSILDALEKNVRDSLKSLGENVVYVQKWPWGMGGEYPWWKYMNRPQPTLEDLEEIRSKSIFTSVASFVMQFQSLIRYNNNSVPNSSVMAVTTQYEEIRSFEIETGRYFSPFELQAGRNVAVIGNTLASELFLGINPVGQSIKIGGYKAEVIGVMKKEGKSAFDDESLDDLVIVPVGFAKSLVDLRRVGPWIMVKPIETATTDDLIDELRGILRSFRRLKPIEDDDFSLNQISMLKQGLDNIFGAINLGGWIIGGFSILVGGFGIANIMFVSVKERTNVIGIQKALGAKNYFILLQFLYESVLLSVMGGAIGLLIIFGGTLLVSNLTEFNISLTAGNVILGLTISAVIGVVSGFAPAWSASRLNPVEAINTKS
jgi:putative ABC transport system permease protein